jgi:hypothetical protein
MVLVPFKSNFVCFIQINTKIRMISKSSTIEEIINDDPEFVNYLFKHGIRCIRCGEPIWGTLEEAAIEKGFNQEQIQKFVEEMNGLLTQNKQK